MELMEYLARGTVKRQHRAQKPFFRKLQRAASHSQFPEVLRRFRDSIIRSVLTESEQPGGLTIALNGVQGGEGTSLVSLLLAVSLGTNTHYRVAHLDGRFESKRFDALRHYLKLSRSPSADTGSLVAYAGQRQSNVFFLSKPSSEGSLEFFSDKGLNDVLEGCRKRFDFTIFDMPPLTRESSNVFLAPAVDRRYLVVAAGKTRLVEVDRCIQAYSEAQVGISGVVVNHQKTPLWSRFLWKEYFA